MEKSSQSYRNRLLELLHPLDLDRLRQHLEPVVLEYRQSLYEAKPITSVYFPIDGVVSLVNTMADGSSVEVGTIGNEGVVGLPVILGDHLAATDVYIKVTGTGLRLPADILTAELERSSGTRMVMRRYAHAFFNHVAQSAACSHHHNIAQLLPLALDDA